MAAAPATGTRLPQCLPGTDDLLFSFWGQTFYTARSLAEDRHVAPGDPGQDALGGATVIGVYADERTPAGGRWRRGRDRRRLDVHRSTTPEQPGDRRDRRASTGSSATNAPGSTCRPTAPPSMRRAVRCKRHLVWVDRNGSVTQLPGDARRDQRGHALARRQARRAVTARLSQWVEDLATGTRTRIVSDLLTCRAAGCPATTGSSLSSNKDGRLGSVYGQRQRQRRHEAAAQEAAHAASDVRRAGRLVLYYESSPGHGHGSLDPHARRAARGRWW